MSRSLGFVCLTLALTIGWQAPAAAQAPEALQLMNPLGDPVDWTEWLNDRGPTAVLVWSTWVPDSRVTASRFDALARACSDRGLGFVVIDVQEPRDAARRVLEAHDVQWLHDRHGAVLKHYRVTRLPRLLIVAGSGEVLARLDPSPEALAGWRADETDQSS
jgi:hypothetical protein